MSFQPKLPPHLLHRRRPSLKRQQGVALVIALFMVALVAAMSYMMMARVERDIRRTTLILRDTQAEFLAQGSIAWAMDQLRQNVQNQKANQRVDQLPLTSPVNVIEGYRITSTIEDMQARFNINNLTEAESQEAFKRLLLTVSPKLTPEQAQGIIKAVIDWISPGARSNSFSNYYAHLPSPYRAAHRPLLLVSELLLVQGMTPALFKALQPYVSALPADTQINVQTAPAPVLMTLSKTLSLASAKAIEQWRNTQPLASVDSFVNGEIVRNHAMTAKRLTVLSRYFLIVTQVVIEKQHVVLYTLLERNQQSGKVTFNVIWQSKGME